MMLEIWKPCPGFEMHYEVSSLGHVRSRYWKTPRILKPVVDRYGYATVHLRAPTYAKRCKVHRLVCEAFHGASPSSGHETGHSNGNRSDNSVNNLRWVTRSENVRDAMLHGTHRLRRATPDEMARGSAHHSAKLTEQVVIEARARYAAGESGRSLATLFGVTSANMSAALRGDSWSRAESDAPKDAPTVEVRP